MSAREASHSLLMDLCATCGLAQLAEDDTVVDEPRGVEPQALRDQAEAAIGVVDAAGWLNGATAIEFGSPHGGSWMPLLAERGYRPATCADVVLDCFGIMHEPDQRAAFAQRARVIRHGGVLLLQYHSLATIVTLGQWNSLRHGHFAYYSLTSLTRLLRTVGLSVARAWEFDLYGGTVLLAAVHGESDPDDSVQRILATEAELGITRAAVVARLQDRADEHIHALRRWLESESEAGRRVFAYGAASRAVSVFSRAGIDSRLVAGVADASVAKQGRRMPGTNIEIISPEQLLARNPDCVLLMLPDLLPEISVRYPQLDGRWKVDGQ